MQTPSFLITATLAFALLVGGCAAEPQSQRSAEHATTEQATPRWLTPLEAEVRNKYPRVLAMRKAGVATQYPNADFPIESTPTAAEAYRALGLATAFEGTAITSSAYTSPQIHWMNLLLDRDDAPQSFASLLKSPSKEAQLYALCGLYYSDRAYFQSVIDRYLKDESQVRDNRFGCIVGFEQVKVIAALIEDGTIPREFVAAHLQRDACRDLK